MPPLSTSTTALSGGEAKCPFGLVQKKASPDDADPSSITVGWKHESVSAGRATACGASTVRSSQTRLSQPEAALSTTRCCPLWVKAAPPSSSVSPAQMVSVSQVWMLSRKPSWTRTVLSQPN